MQRKILRGVRLEGKVYTAGQEEALYRDADAPTLTRLVNRGSVVGDWLPDAVPSATAGNDELKVLLPLGQEVIDELIAGGYATVDAITGASDSELKALPKIGAAAVKKIRAILNTESDNS